MTLTIIIVSYNVRNLLETCLRSVFEAAAGISTEVFVVDNNSSDGTVEHFGSSFPALHILHNPSNLGFSKANNQALRLARGRYVLFLNPDTVLPADCFQKCVSFMDTHPQAGALGVRMIDGTGRYLPESKRGLPTPATSFWKLSGISAMFPRSRYFARYYLGNLSEWQTNPVDVLSGAYFFSRKSVLDLTGGFDERFFMYAEDIDLSYRITQAGFLNYYFPEVTITHLKGSSTTRDLQYVKTFYGAMSLFAHKYYGDGLYTRLLDAGIALRSAVERLKIFISRTSSKRHG